ncbi:MAG: DUF4293 domain-containing protein [Mucilaginibacter sp.]
MLQRIQSIYLLLASLALAALFIFPLLHNIQLNGVTETIKVTGVDQQVNGQTIHTETFTALAVVTALVALLPFIIIFLYKNRKLQITLCYSAMLVIIGDSYWASQTAKDAIYGTDIQFNNYGIGVILLSASILLVVLAQKAIQRDDKLVKSADRLR